MTLQRILNRRGVRQSLFCGVASVVALGLVTLVIASPRSFETRPRPSDEPLIAHWKKHRLGFEELLTMFQSDKELSGIGPTFLWPEDRRQAGITLGRLRDYRKRCRALGLNAGIECYDAKQSIWFLGSGRGALDSGFTKGYVYMTEPPENVVASLDRYPTEDGRPFTAYRHLDGNWYLFLQYDN